MSRLIIGLFLFSLICFTNAAISPPYYSQHDRKWGSKTLGFGPDSISEKGCLLSTIASMVAYEGITVSGQVADPNTMNTWFKAHKGFRGTILFYDAVEDLGFTFEGIVTSTSEIKDAMNEGKFAMLHVKNGRHWVLATGFISGGYSVMDPGNVTYTYKYADVVGCAIYSFPSSKARKLYEQPRDAQLEESESVNPTANVETESVTTTSPDSIPSDDSNLNPNPNPKPTTAAAASPPSNSQKSRSHSTPGNLRKRSAN